MIVTVTANPAIDVRYELDDFVIGGVHRALETSKTAGGKGLNVSRVLSQLDEEVSATGFLGGSAGETIRTTLQHLQINDLFTVINGETRNCIAIHHGGKQTEILEKGPTITGPETDALLKNFREILKDADVTTMSGSLPAGVEADFYTTLIKEAHTQSVPVVLDTNGSTLQKVLQKSPKPSMMKPNLEEFEDLVGQSLATDNEMARALKSPLFGEISTIVVTLGSDGAIIKHNEIIYRVSAPQIEAKNPVGSGDAVTAGLATGIKRGYKDEELFSFALSLGALNAQEKETGHIDIRQLERVKSRVNIKRL
ncbi:hexose kinase [Natribacillus halophilus]|uniref:Tagatose-6-phosphate kinase n=1 Tax=Natribacillus halophilus TaxID=549003 RepID=A0A1G8N298_9BACI|nr:hexose kinase [Natribacillus halophilus]SDI74379.1 tagatose-6-phosphate kinase [Natribacillus halophilus]